MNYLSLTFFIFISAFVCIYYMVNRQYRYIVLFIGSYIFYGWANVKMLAVLILVTVVSYVGGLIIEKQKKKSIFGLFFFIEIAILAVYKYTDFAIININYFAEKMNLKPVAINWNIVLPVGLSFMVFQACTYLSDVYRKNFDAEKNILKYATFVAFFPTVLSGPIQKARNLLPQISDPKVFDVDNAKQGTLLFVWGAFEKIMVANKLNYIYLTVLTDYSNRTSAEVLIGAISFSLYIYADFSSYSDMARGISKIIGIDVGKNFNNPYLSCSTAEFWNRWHMSLNEWFLENIYIPMGGNRKGIIRKYINMMTVFFVSGLWHGASWHFVAWGVINGVFVVIGYIIKPLKSRIYGIFNVEEQVESVVLIKRIIVFYLITLTWVFFTSGITDSLMIWKKLIVFDFLSLFNPNLLNIGGTAVGTFITMLAVLLFCKLQMRRQNTSVLYDVYNKQPLVFQCLPVAVVICICIFGNFATDANVDAQFLYFQF